MMLALLRDNRADEICTPGKLYIDGLFECFTLEDPIREYPNKIPKNTCIWGNRAYRVTIDYSPKFKRTMLHILDVPLFVGIRIHSGLNAGHTEGCVLVGNEGTTSHSLTRAPEVLQKLEAKVQFAIDHKEEVLIVVANPVE